MARRTHFPIANYRGYASASVANACAIAYTRDTLIHDGSICARNDERSLTEPATPVSEVYTLEIQKKKKKKPYFYIAPLSAVQTLFSKSVGPERVDHNYLK